MKKIVTLIAVLAIMAMSTFAMAATAGTVTVVLDVQSFMDLTAGTALHLDVNSPQDLASLTPTAFGGAFTLRSNVAATLTVVPDAVTQSVIWTSGMPTGSGPYYSPTAYLADNHASWGLGYGLTCIIDTVGTSWNFESPGSLVIPVAVGTHTGQFSVNSYLDSVRPPAGQTSNLAPVGLYTSVLTLTITAA